VVDAISLKSEVLWELRRTLRNHDFKEVVTPVARRADLGPGKRATAELGERRYLRSMIGPALRHNLQFQPRIFEIGPCFRLDQPDLSHSREFTMLDLYAADEDFEFLFKLAEELVAGFVGSGFERISIAQRMHDKFGLNLNREHPRCVREKIAQHVGARADATLQEIIDSYIEQDLEPLSAGRRVFLWEFPVGGNEPCARIKPGTEAVLNRFELFVNGIEVVHGYQDETDAEAFVSRAIEAGLYDEEQRIVQDEISQGKVPPDSIGLGIGIERLCMAATGADDIGIFRQSAHF
jgi:lysyl-tRNA synthetase class 2